MCCATDCCFDALKLNEEMKVGSKVLIVTVSIKRLGSLLLSGSGYNLLMPDELRRGGKDRLISLSQAAEMYGFNPVYLGELARKGRLRAQKVGASWVTTPAAMEEYIRSRRKRGAYRNDIQPD